MRINEEITASNVRLVGENITEPGVYSLSAALKMADAQGLDLVEISAKADPPVCKIIDYQKFLYQQKKKGQGDEGQRGQDSHKGNQVRAEYG